MTHKHEWPHIEPILSAVDQAYDHYEDTYLNIEDFLQQKDEYYELVHNVIYRFINDSTIDEIYINHQGKIFTNKKDKHSIFVLSRADLTEPSDIIHYVDFAFKRIKGRIEGY